MVGCQITAMDHRCSPLQLPQSLLSLPTCDLGTICSHPTACCSQMLIHFRMTWSRCCRKMHWRLFLIRSLHSTAGSSGDKSIQRMEIPQHIHLQQLHHSVKIQLGDGSLSLLAEGTGEEKCDRLRPESVCGSQLSGW